MPTPEAAETGRAGRAAAPASKEQGTIAVLTATRAEYGLLRWLMEDIRSDPDLRLQVCVTGAHLDPDLGETWKVIAQDGFTLDALAPLPRGAGSRAEIAKGMATAGQGMAKALERLRPDILVVLGDRYELLPVVSAALILDVPVAHISGGDVTEGAIDDQVRHAVTKLADLHFPATPESAARIAQMGEEPERITVAGELGLDAFRRLTRPSRADLAADLGLDPFRPWALVTWHPETKKSLEENLDAARAIGEALLRAGPWPERDGRPGGRLQSLVTYANADYGGPEINACMESLSRKRPADVVVHDNLGQRRYIGMLHEAACMVGNSSSGIFEAASAQLPVLNIGDRQKGRPLTRNVVQCGPDAASIAAGLRLIQSPGFLERLCGLENPYGDGRAAETVLRALKRWLAPDLRPLLKRKRFVTLPLVPDARFRTEP